MIKKIALGLLVLGLLTSCVSKKVYTDLEAKFADLKKENRNMSIQNDSLSKAKNKLDLNHTALKADYEKLKAERDKLAADYAIAAKNLKTLQEAYQALEKNSDESLQANMAQNRELLAQLEAKEKALAEEKDRLGKTLQANMAQNQELLAQLEAKEKALAEEKDRLNKLNSDLKDRSNRVIELEGMIAAKETAMKKLKETLSKSLKAFEGKGLTVQQKEGKVYVSMENKLLFESGSWAVGPEGKKAVVAVGKVLGDNPEIAVLIEGHTDNDKFGGAMGQIENNWDLSTKRATAIVAILSENKAVKKENLTAAGRGEFAPLMSNDSAEGKAKNRRIEIILTPKLDEVSKMLNEL